MKKARHGGGGTRTLDDVIDELGVGLGQNLIVLFGGELFSGLIKTLVTVTSTSFAHDLGYSKLERGWLVSMLFVGNFVGNLASGATSDYCGRRFTLLLGYVVALLSLTTSLFAVSFGSMLLCRTCLGLAAGLMGPTSWALLGELSPSKSRMWIHAAAHYTWFAGGATILLLVHLADPMMRDVPWHGLTAFTLSVVALCFLGAMFFVVESPSYLCLKSRRDDAIETLETLRSRNGVQLDVHNWEMHSTESEPNRSWSYAALFTRSNVFTTLTLCLTTFSLNYSSYGMLYALPIILRSSKLNVVPSATMLLNLVCGAVGLALSLPASAASRSRLGLLGGVLLMRAACCVCFFVGLWYQDSSNFIVILTLSGVCGKTLLDSIAYVLVYLYAIEVRATESRASSSGMALAVGRLGGVCAPVIFELLYAPSIFVLSMCFLALVCAGLVLGLPIETKDRQLGEIAAESTPLSKAAV